MTKLATKINLNHKRLDLLDSIRKTVKNLKEIYPDINSLVIYINVEKLKTNDQTSDKIISKMISAFNLEIQAQFPYHNIKIEALLVLLKKKLQQELKTNTSRQKNRKLKELKKNLLILIKSLNQEGKFDLLKNQITNLISINHQIEKTKNRIPKITLLHLAKVLIDSEKVEFYRYTNEELLDTSSLK